MARKGCSLTEQEVKRIVTLLAGTDLTIGAIAERMSCSRSAIVAVNRRYQVRKYEGLKSRWTLQARS